MNKFLVATAGLAALATSASAADMRPYSKAAPMAAPVMTYNWTGCYVGGNVGGGWARTEQTRIAQPGGTAGIFDYGSSEGSNVVGGVQIGCDYQFAGNWVIGAQGMFDFGNISSSHAITAFPTFSSTIRTKDTTTATARLGYVFAPQVLGYVKGGAAWTSADYNVYQPGGILLSESAGGVNRQGWTIGGGVEWAFAPGWSVFGEYNYMDFGNKDVAFVRAAGAFGSPDVVRNRLEVQQALFGVNYKFGGWGR